MLSNAEQTILGVLLRQASSKGRKNFSTWTSKGFGSGNTVDELMDPEDGDSGDVLWTEAGK